MYGAARLSSQSVPSQTSMCMRRRRAFVDNVIRHTGTVTGLRRLLVVTRACSCGMLRTESGRGMRKFGRGAWRDICARAWTESGKYEDASPIGEASYVLALLSRLAGGYFLVSTTMRGAVAEEPMLPTAFSVYTPISNGLEASTMNAPDSLA